MTIKELKKEISDLPDEMEVILQKDSEGNGYSPLAGADPEAIYMKSNSWSGEVFNTKWTASDAGFSDKEWENMKQNPRVLILYPVN